MLLKVCNFPHIVNFLSYIYHKPDAGVLFIINKTPASGL